MREGSENDKREPQLLIATPNSALRADELVAEIAANE